VQKAYKEYAAKVKLSGPTSFAPIINKAVEIVREKKQVSNVNDVSVHFSQVTSKSRQLHPNEE
jgi:hypothetical protein